MNNPEQINQIKSQDSSEEDEQLENRSDDNKNKPAVFYFETTTEEEVEIVQNNHNMPNIYDFLRNLELPAYDLPELNKPKSGLIEIDTSESIEVF